MWIPLAILAALSLAGGYLFNVPEYLRDLFPAIREPDNPALLYFSVAAGFLGIGVAYIVYIARPGMADSIADSIKAVVPVRLQQILRR